METIEIKIKETGTRWEETPVLVKVIVESLGDAQKFGRGIANAYKTEVRWNIAWSNQGHYIFPEIQ